MKDLFLWFVAVVLYVGGTGSKTDCRKGGVSSHGVSPSWGSWNRGLHGRSHRFHSLQWGCSQFSNLWNECVRVHSQFLFRMILWHFLSLQVVPVVDGNVVRVISRLYAISDNPKESSTMKRFWLAALSSPCWQLKELEFILFVFLLMVECLLQMLKFFQ